MAAQYELQRPDEVATKVLRRAQVSKMTRALQDRLALANVKIQNGWENMSLDVIEPQVEERMRRKRPASSNDTISDTASTTSSYVTSASGIGSSPLTAPMFSDDFQRSGSNYSSKKTRQQAVMQTRQQAVMQTRQQAVMQKGASSGAATGRRTRVATRQATWKKNHSLPESSPIDHAKHARFASNHVSKLSFISEGSTVLDSPPSPAHSEDDDTDLPVLSFTMNTSTRIISSPPQTPPPDRRMRKAHNVSWSRTPKHGEEGVDLLMYLAASPSPANGPRVQTIVQPPTTPPCKSTPLPSSHMTPITSCGGFMGFGPHTPGTNFNFADFVNVTPSPAQAAWTRTPIAGRTPATAREARRRLNFDAIVPPSSSPVMVRSAKVDRMSMDIGGDLVS
ncbi:hypothetical protein LTR08_005688 [Meristemomyces frigidus]|nr:hypothetical protein LTR08_005688 [Meristemomyces frigidus]